MTRPCRVDDNDVRLNAELLLTAREHCRGENSVFRRRFRLILSQFCDECILPGLTILGINNDAPARLPFVEHLVENISASLPLLNTRDLVPRKGNAELFQKINLGPVTHLVGGLPLELTLHFYHLLL